LPHQSGHRFVIRRLLVVSVVMVASISPAWAYIDPNAGGFIFQILMPILSLGIAGVALLRRRIAAFFASLWPRLTAKAKTDPSASEH